jgi:hypothetical protein
VRLENEDMADWVDLYYPEVAGRGLSAALQQELDHLGVGVQLRASWLHPSNEGWTMVERGPRRSQVCSATDRRLFILTLSGEELLYFEFKTDSLPEIALAISVWLSEQAPSGEETEERCPFLHLTPSARLYERGEEIKAKWQQLLAGILHRPPHDEDE